MVQFILGADFMISKVRFQSAEYWEDFFKSPFKNLDKSNESELLKILSDCFYCSVSSYTPLENIVMINCSEGNLAMRIIYVVDDDDKLDCIRLGQGLEVWENIHYDFCYVFEENEDLAKELLKGESLYSSVGLFYESMKRLIAIYSESSDKVFEDIFGDIKSTRYKEKLKTSLNYTGTRKNITLSRILSSVDKTMNMYYTFDNEEVGEVLYKPKLIDIRTSTGSKKSFDFIEVEASVMTSVPLEKVKSIINKNLKCVVKDYLEVVKNSSKFKKFGVPVNCLKIGKITFTNRHTLNIVFELKQLQGFDRETGFETKTKEDEFKGTSMF